jgi:hypothetical protein
MDASPPASYAAASLSGPSGDRARQAVADRDEVIRRLNALPKAERERFGDVARSASALADRVGCARDLARGAVAPRRRRPRARCCEREIQTLENAANPLERGSEDRVRRLAYLKRQRRALVDAEKKRHVVAEKLETCALALQSMRYDMMRLSASPQMHQHITSLANKALSLAENCRRGGARRRRAGTVGQRAHLRRAARHVARVPDLLLDRLVAAVGAQYLVDAEIGRGGMAVVYRATDVRLNRRVAIKLLPPELAFNPDVRERFLREAQTSAQLTHPHIVPIFTVDEREGLVYFVMALVDGESLAQRLAREPKLPIADTRRILADVADALAYAHGRGVVHRDVKPDNVMIDRVTGRAVVTDFGIARARPGIRGSP